MSESGTLYIVATPLGNLDDITFRAVQTLREADAIACEDTRRASILLRHLSITGKRLLSYHSHNEHKTAGTITGLLLDGTSVALVTDAGTPAVSDPGYTLVQEAWEAGIRIVPIPGPSALTTALSVCPLPTSSFYFAGFLPHKKGRKSRLEYLASLQSTFVLYESPYRIPKLLDELDIHCPDARIFVARELTKLHEELLCGSSGELREHFMNRKIRGEFVVIVSPAPSLSTTKNSSNTDADHH
ncbi:MULTISPECIES: 16S rRNA (cytidine(1402)-2'-O)-methyltransferase [Prosthecochloris]|uniref:Ribosomal RNA small subunit methyltransferase I n=1 Tax=Prosthecochloris vibrioformis TaxID=1098 RepID=A0A5C4S1P2_PROVB|nr:MULTISPECIES: 16S rRNA (cytidine(1402)-2'-O)-methyltransferase [Prosthecochloris]ANT64336.1 Ribosomal RNA small subunit methyltransferase I [Prosthecochloris sp. CIB 2401]TNJ37195.1 16S rRNA (cytidine(1402)-2'-O)-methyltransferase [Prosthecochloris vibrioformis]